MHLTIFIGALIILCVLIYRNPKQEKKKKRRVKQIPLRRYLRLPKYVRTMLKEITETRSYSIEYVILIYGNICEHRHGLSFVDSLYLIAVDYTPDYFEEEEWIDKVKASDQEACNRVFYQRLSPRYQVYMIFPRFRP